MVGINYYSLKNKNGCLNYDYFSFQNTLEHIAATWNFYFMSLEQTSFIKRRTHYTGLQIMGLYFLFVESESEIRISPSRQHFEIFKVMCSKNGIFRYFWGYVQGARIFFGFFLKCHHLALLFPFKMSCWTVTNDFFSQRYGHVKFWHLSEQPYEHSHWLFGAYHCLDGVNLVIPERGSWRPPP